MFRSVVKRMKRGLGTDKDRFFEILTKIFGALIHLGISSSGRFKVVLRVAGFK